MIAMFVIHIVYMFAELITGIVCHSLTLTGDSFHMLSDTISMVIGFLSIRLGKKKADNKQTFGYKRLEILGAFFNASFLLSTAFFLITELLEKFIDPSIPNEIDVVLYVSIGGIVINIIGMILTGHEGHDHGHGHSHGHAHGHEHHHEEHEHEHEEHEHHDHDHEHSDSSCDSHKHEQQETVEVAKEQPQQEKEDKKDKKGKKDKKQKKEKKQHKDMALRGVFLHVLGDFLGSIVAIAAALVVKFAGESSFAPYADPTGSCIMVIILIRASVPLLLDSMNILLLTSNVDTEKVKNEIESLPNVKVHDLHIWQYLPDQPVAHCHVEFQECDDTISREEYDKRIEQIQQIFHSNDIHKTAVEVELLGKNEVSMSQCFQTTQCNEQQQWK